MTNNNPKWTGYFKFISPVNPTKALSDSQEIPDAGTYANNTWYQRLVQGSAARLSRYREYDMCDNDVEISRALDTIAEEMSGNNTQTDMPIDIDILTEEEKPIMSSTVLTLKAALRRWCQIHDFDNKIFPICRNMVKYGDVFFRKIKGRDTWTYIHPKNVIAALVDENDVSKVIGWQIKEGIKDAKPNISGYSSPTRHDSTEIVPASEIIRFSLNDSMSDTQPFGESVLRPVYRAFKQKELLEDAIIIYRIQRAPERRAFYIDVGKMPPQRVKRYLESIKNEIKQKRIPTMNGGQAEVDSVYNPQCLTLDTKIPLLDGRELSLSEIISEFEQGKKNWVYSINPENGAFAPGEISWAGITRTNAQIVKLTLDNGQTLTCTPDHKIPVQGQGFKEAKDIVVHEDSLFPFNTRMQQLSNKKLQYKQVYDTSKQDWVYVHRAVAEFIKNAGITNEIVHSEKYRLYEKHTVHHMDYNKFNNSPENLVYMNSQDHIAYHKDHARESNSFAKIKLHISKLKQDSVYRMEHSKRLSEKMQARLSKNPQQREKLRQSWMQRRSTQKLVNTSLTFTTEMFDIVVTNILNNVDISLNELIANINKDVNFMTSYSESNGNVFRKTSEQCGINKIRTDVFSKRSLRKMMIEHGYTNFKTLRDKIRQQGSVLKNHRVVKIEFLEQTEDVGTITVDGFEILHNYHTFATSCGIYVKNSTGEDFFFATRDGGRGTRVETLPGGQNLGDLADLNFFLRKLWRGLRVPASYMIEQNEGGLQWNDGKVGVAYIQELRFALFVKRMQSQVENVMDVEFKKFLKAKNILIDENMYRLKLPDPSNFGQYRQQELDSQLLSSYGNVENLSYVSPRFAMKRYLQMTDEEIITNERMRREELGLNPNGGPTDYPKLYSKGENASGGIGGMGGGSSGFMDGGFGGAPGDMTAGGTEQAPEAGAEAGKEAPPETGASKQTEPKPTGKE